MYSWLLQRKLPWRWAPIDLLVSSEFSEASDVWAFGVTVWEIFTLGQTPYEGRRFGPEFVQFLQAGNRLTKPENASEQMYVPKPFFVGVPRILILFTLGK